MKSIVIVLMATLSLNACSEPVIKLIGKWSMESSIDQLFGHKSGDSPADIVEFTATERIHKGDHEQIELVDQGSDVVVYRTILGTKLGQTYKFIDKNTAVLDEPFDKQTFHKVN